MLIRRAPPASTSCPAARPGTRLMSPSPIAAVINAPPMPSSGSHLAFRNAALDIATGARSGSRLMGSGCGCDSGPSHQVAKPMLREAPQIPMIPASTPNQVATVTDLQPMVSCPRRGGGGTQGARSASLLEPSRCGGWGSADNDASITSSSIRTTIPQVAGR